MIQDLGGKRKIIGRFSGRAAAAVLLLLLLIGGLIALSPRSVKAQGGDFEVLIGLPNEGETFYAGPSSFLYNIPVYGFVFGQDLSYQDIDIKLQIVQNGTLIKNIDGQLYQDGTFNFEATVNPDHPVGRFNRVDGEYDPTKLSCGECCHFPRGLTLPEGDVTLRVIATDENGREAVDVRHIQIDLARYLSVPVQVSIPDSEVSLEDVQVVGSVRFYLWRTRNFYGRTDAEGRTDVKVEVLREAPTKVQFGVEPVIVNGIKYQSLNQETLVIQPDAEQIPQVSLELVAQAGLVRGQLIGDVSVETGFSVWAVRKPTGAAFQAEVSEEGKFHFSELPLGEYVLILEDSREQVKAAGSTPLDLQESTQRAVRLPVQKTAGTVVEGRVVDEQGEEIPLAWVQTGQQEVQTAPLDPFQGIYRLIGLAEGQVRLIASAPGYYSQEIALDTREEGGESAVFALKSKPGLSVVSWGEGKLYLPGESIEERAENVLRLKRGWVWGRGKGGQALRLRVGEVEILLPEDEVSFAVEYLPGRTGWFYLQQGTAQIFTPEQGDDIITVRTGEMVNLLGEQRLQAVAYHSVVLEALETRQNTVQEPSWQPTLLSRIKESAAAVSLGIGQFVVYAMYLIIIGFAVGAAESFLRQNHQDQERKPEEDGEEK